jgi:hypothetical protein
MSERFPLDVSPVLFVVALASSAEDVELPTVELEAVEELEMTEEDEEPELRMDEELVDVGDAVVAGGRGADEVAGTSELTFIATDVAVGSGDGAGA